MRVYGFIGSAVDRDFYHRQYYGIQAYASNHSLGRVEFVEEAEFGLEDTQNKNLRCLIDSIRSGDIFIVKELSRLGQSNYEIIEIIMALLHKSVQIHTVDGGFQLGGSGEHLILSLIVSLVLEMQHQFIDSRINESVVSTRKEGSSLGRPTGRGASRLDGREEEIMGLLAEGTSKADMARQMQISRPALYDFLKSRNLT